MLINERDSLLTPFSKITLKEQYCLPGESYQEAFYRASQAFSGGDQALAERLYFYSSNLWFSFATPLLANGGTNKGLPISCFLNYVEDSVRGLCNNFTETAFLSVSGGGIGTYWGNIRSIGEGTSRGLKTPGVMPFMHVQDSQMLAYHQGATRRGAAAAYLDISHPEIVEFIAMRSPTGGDVHRKNENMHHGVCLSDDFMKAVKDDLPWNLVDPHSKQIHETVSARGLWIKILQQRIKSGEPYLFFIDTANRALPAQLKEKGLRIYHSNLCTEIVLPTNENRTAVCCLSSVNIAALSQWWDVREQFIEDLITMLDNALNVFCDKASEELWRAVASVVSERSIGLGTLGFHTYLQMNDIPFESQEAIDFNIEFYKELNALAKKASQKLAKERGEPLDLQGFGYRHAHLISIAPNASSSIICGVSPSIEPLVGNSFTHKTRAGSNEVRNPVLVNYLESIGKNTPEVWRSITLNSGSVQHLDFLPEHKKRVFLTAFEINQQHIIKMACDRQPFVCQAQSVNVFFPPNPSPAELHKVHFSAWEGGLKSLYYARSSSIKTTSIGAIPTVTKEMCSTDCSYCEG